MFAGLNETTALPPSQLRVCYLNVLTAPWPPPVALALLVLALVAALPRYVICEIGGSAYRVGDGEAAGFAKTIGVAEITPLASSITTEWFGFMSAILSF